MVVAILGAAVVLVFGCFGGFLLTSVLWGLPTDTSTPTRAIDTLIPAQTPTDRATPIPTPAPTDTATPIQATTTPTLQPTATPTPKDAPTAQPTPTPTTPPMDPNDLAYLECARDVMLDAGEITEDIAAVAYEIDPGVFCSAQSRWAPSTEDLWTSHDSCPEPMSGILQWAWVYLDEVLLQMNEAVLCYGKYCLGNPLETYWLDTGTEHLQEANRYLELATAQFSRYAGSQ